MASLAVERYGFVESGYVTRAAVVLLTLAATARQPTARWAYAGVGLLWAAAEGVLVASGAREGPAVLAELGGGAVALGCVVRGFAEGAAVAGIALVPDAFGARVAAALLLVDAAWLDPAAELVSRREVLRPAGVVVTLLGAGGYLARLAWTRGAPRFPEAAARRAFGLGLAWNAVAAVRGSRVVDPPAWGMAFLLYDAAFEIALLYAGLAELVLFARAACTRAPPPAPPAPQRALAARGALTRARPA